MNFSNLVRNGIESGSAKNPPKSNRRASNSSPDILRTCGVACTYTASPTKAKSLIAEILADAGEDGLIAIDFETEPQPSEVARLALLRAEIEALRERSESPPQDEQIKTLRLRWDYVDTAALDPHRGGVRLCQLYAGGKRSVVIDMRSVPWELLDPVWEQPLVAHNSAFELSFLFHQGIEPAEIHCTMQMTRLLGGTKRISLEDAVQNHLDLAISKEMQKSDWSAAHLTPEQLAYAATDPLVTWLLAEKLFPLLDTRAPAYEIQVGAMPAMVRMQLRGVAVDQVKYDAIFADLTVARDKARLAYGDACNAVGRPDLRELGIPKPGTGTVQLLEEILTDEHIEEWERTEKSQQLSTQKDALRLVAADYPPLEALLALREIEKQFSMYGKRWLARLNPITGRMHSSYMTAGAVTGRATCSKPNIQQLAKEQRVKGLSSLREIIVAGPGKLLIPADYHLMEMRAAASLSGDVAMLDAIRNGVDLHRLTAAEMLGITPEAVTKAERDLAKKINFGAIYGQGPVKLARVVRIEFGRRTSRYEAEEWQRAHRNRYPQLADWIAKQKRNCEIDRKVVIHGGREYHYDWDDDDVPHDERRYHGNQALNMPIQGSCANVFMLALAEFDHALYQADIEGGAVLVCHDEIVPEVREQDAERTAIILRDSMVNAYLRVFPGAPTQNLVELKICQTWGRAD